MTARNPHSHMRPLSLSLVCTAASWFVRPRRFARSERCEQFPNDVKLRHHDDCQNPPQPYATVVLALGLHSSLLVRAAPAVCRQFLLQQTALSNNGVHFLAFRAQEQCTEDELWVDWR